MGACRPNCYADDLVFPEYFARHGLTYSRSRTLAEGSTRCEFNIVPR